MMNSPGWAIYVLAQQAGLIPAFFPFYESLYVEFGAWWPFSHDRKVIGQAW